MTGKEGQPAIFDTFNGLRTDCPASKCDPEHSPDCADVVFTVGGYSTRNPLRVVDTLPAAIVVREEFQGRDESTYVVYLCVDGSLYAQTGATYTRIDRVAAGSTMKSVVAYGRLYMAFFDASGGTDAPRCWDGKNLYRVSQGGPGAAPTVQCVSMNSVNLSGTPLLVRSNSEVTATTDAPHGLREGFKVAIDGVDDQTYPITSIQTDASDYPGKAQITFATNPGFVNGDTLLIKNVPYVDVGGGVATYNIRNGIASVTMNSAHGLTQGLSVVVSLHDYAPRTVTVAEISSPTTWTYESEEPNVTDTGGYVHVPWPGEDGATYTVAEVPSDTKVRIAFQASDFTWTGGEVDFPWNGAYFVDSVPSDTSFTYQQTGPDAEASGTSGTATPQGQISPGEHQAVVIYITETGAFTPPSPPVRFVAKVNQYPVVTLPIGPANIKARIVGFTGVNGGDFAVMEIPARVGGIPVSTSTLVNDNTSTTALFDFADTTILSAERIDEDGFYLFRNYPLTTPDGVEWYSDRMFWSGDLNVELGLLNMAFDGGTLSGSTDPLGWTVVGGGGGIQQDGFMPVYTIAGGSSGELRQSAVRNYDGVQIVKGKTRYRARLWVDGAHAGAIVVTLYGTGFSTSANVNMTGLGYAFADFDADTPANIPNDLMLSVKSTSGEAVAIRDVQLVYRDNPKKFPNAVASYVREPDNYDGVTGLNGPNDDSSGISAMFRMQENLYGIMKVGRLYYVQPNAYEPSTWNWQGLSDDCPVFNANAVTTGKGWAAWGGSMGAFWFTGGLPNRASAVIDPTWQALTGLNCAQNDPVAKRVYFADGTQAFVYDYHELELGGSGKWTTWKRPISWVSLASGEMSFASSLKTYRLDSVQGIADDTFGNIGGYYCFSAVAASALYQKSYNYLMLRMAGIGTMTPYLYGKTLQTVTKTLAPQDLAQLGSIVAEYPVNLNGRLLFMKIGQPGMAYSMEEVAIAFTFDPNAQITGTRR